MIKRSVLLFAACLLIQNLNSQVRLTGTVIDPETNTGIPYVSIHIKNTDLGYVSDSAGRYNIIIPATVENVKELTFSSIGYQALDISIRKLKDVIALKRTVEPDKEVTISSSLKVMGRDSTRWGLSFLFLSNQEAIVKRDFALQQSAYVFLTSPFSNLQHNSTDRLKLNYLSLISTIGRKYALGKKEGGRLMDLSFRLQPQHLQRLVIRVNVLAGNDYRYLLQKPILLNWQEGMPEKFEVSFKDQQVMVTGDFIVLLEFLQFRFQPGQEFLGATIHGDPGKGRDKAAFKGPWQYSLQFADGFIPAMKVRVGMLKPE